LRKSHVIDPCKAARAVYAREWDADPQSETGGRLVQTQDGTNFFFPFQQSGNHGVEYYLIVGDPNASVVANRSLLINIRPSVELKVVVPFLIGNSTSN